MAAEQRRLLEQLMGMPNQSNTSVHFSDPSVCRSFLVGTCPHDLFTNTKQDLGPCKKLHLESHKADYERARASSPKDLTYEHDYARDLQRYIDECNRRIDAAQRRLDKTPDEITKTNSLLKQIGDLDKSITTGLEEVEILGEQGQVARALEEYHKVKTAKVEKEGKEKELKQLSDSAGPSGHQKLQVCDVCGAYLSRLDNDRRLADHFYGKMHLGYAQMRSTLKKLQEELSSRGPPPSTGPRDYRDDRPYHHEHFDRPSGPGGYGGRGGGGYGRGRGGGGFRGGRGGRGGFSRW
ncbi:splicing factor [Rhizina undulata]